MKRDINSLIGYKIAATDGELGEVTDFYFDDKAWTIRYLIVETGTWLNHRKVLISPEAVLKDFRTPGKFNVNLTVDQIRNSPDIDTQLPVSRQQREILHKHHAWENYWEANIFGGGDVGTSIPVNEEEELERAKKLDIHLRSAMHVSGYHIHASDGELGHVNNFILEDATWRITHLVIDTAKWISTHKVLVDVSHVEAVQWYNLEVFLDITQDELTGSPEYHPVS